MTRLLSGSVYFRVRGAECFGVYPVTVVHLASSQAADRILTDRSPEACEQGSLGWMLRTSPKRPPPFGVTGDGSDSSPYCFVHFF